MTAAEAFQDLTPTEWAGWVRTAAVPCCAGWPHVDHPAEQPLVAAGWVPIAAGWHVRLWVHPDRPQVALPGRNRP